MEFKYTANNGATTTFEVDLGKGVVSTKWASDDNFWSVINNTQIGNMQKIVNYIASITNKPAAEVAGSILKEQLAFGAYSADGLEDLKRAVSVERETDESEFKIAMLELLSWSENMLKDMKAQMVQQGAAPGCQYIQELDAALWGIDLSKAMFANKAA